MDHDRERDVRLAEHILGWKRVTMTEEALRGDSFGGGYLLVPPSAYVPPAWMVNTEEQERRGDFWANTWPQPIPTFSEDLVAAWRLVERIAPETARRRQDDWEVLKTPVPLSRRYAVRISSYRREPDLMWTCNVVRLLTGEEVCGASGMQLPRVIAGAVDLVIATDGWERGEPTKAHEGNTSASCPGCRALYGESGPCRGLPSLRQEEPTCGECGQSIARHRASVDPMDLGCPT